MALYVVATPIGNRQDLSPRASAILSEAQVVIGEEFRETSTLLKSLGIDKKVLEQLNEHSTPQDIERLLDLCREQTVALVSDCGTPGFCDPGPELVAACRAQKIPVHSIPGPSSLAAFISVCGVRMNQFIFVGFLPADREKRKPALNGLKNESRAQIVMDTPYRMGRLLTELSEALQGRMATIGIELSSEQEEVITAPIEILAKKLGQQKAQFMLLIHPSKFFARKISSKK